MAFWIFIAGVTIYVLVAGISDFRIQRVPNTITVPAALIGLAFNIIAGMFGSPHWSGVSALLPSLAGFAVGLALLWIPFAFGGGGAGDVKFLAALGAWLGPWYLFLNFALGIVLAFLGGVYKWTMLAVTVGPWKARDKLRTNPTPKPQSSSNEPKKRRKTNLALIVPMAIATLAILYLIAFDKNNPRVQLRPWGPPIPLVQEPTHP